MNPFKEKYPLLFRNEDPMEPINMFGIECSSGWDVLLNSTFHLLYSKYKAKLNALNFWKKMEADDTHSKEKIDEYIAIYEEELKQVASEVPIIDQCKEKFGTLRLYCSNTNFYFEGVIDMAETMSSYICEICGSGDAKLSGRGWVSTLCPPCTEKRDNRIKEIQNVSTNEIVVK